MELESPRQLQAQEPPALSSGSLVHVEVSLFNPDLRTMQQQAAPESTWSALSDYPQPIEYVTKSIEVLQSGGKFYLSNPRLKQVDATVYLQPQHLVKRLYSIRWTSSAQKGFKHLTVLMRCKAPSLVTMRSHS